MSLQSPYETIRQTRLHFTFVVIGRTFQNVKTCLVCVPFINTRTVVVLDI